MASLYVYFELPLESIDESRRRHRTSVHVDPDLDFHTGPYFLRWLPEGEKDAINLRSDDPQATIRVWFDGWGGDFPDETEVAIQDEVWDYRRLFANALVQEGGFLSGRLTISEIPDADAAALDAMRSLDAGPVERDRVNRLVHRVQAALALPLHHFVRLLREQFGQYWLPAIPLLPREEHHVQFFALFLGCRWSLNPADAWRGASVSALVDAKVPVRVPDLSEDALAELITDEDWPILGELAARRTPVSPAVESFARAHRLLDEGDVWNALIGAVIALEYAMADYVSRRSNDLERLVRLDMPPDEWHRIPTARIMERVTEGIAEISDENRELARAGIASRNSIVHRRLGLPQRAPEQVAALLRIVSALLPTPRPKRPSAGTTTYRPSFGLYRDILLERDDSDDDHDDE